MGVIMKVFKLTLLMILITSLSSCGSNLDADFGQCSFETKKVILLSSKTVSEIEMRELISHCMHGKGHSFSGRNGCVVDHSECWK